MRRLVVTKQAAEKIVEAGTKKPFVLKQQIARSEKSFCEQKARNPRLFHFKEIFEWKTSVRLSENIGETLYFGGFADVYDKEWNDLDEAILFYQDNPLTLNGYAFQRFVFSGDIGNYRNHSARKTNPFNGFIIESYRSDEPINDGFTQLPQVNPLWGTALAPGDLFLGYARSDCFDDGYLGDETKNPLYRYWNAGGSYLNYNYNPCSPSFASATLVAYPPDDKKEQFKKNGGYLCVFMSASSINVPPLRCVVQNDSSLVVEANSSGISFGWHVGVVFEEYENGVHDEIREGDVVFVDINGEKPLIIAKSFDSYEKTDVEQLVKDQIQPFNTTVNAHGADIRTLNKKVAALENSVNSDIPETMTNAHAYLNERIDELNNKLNSAFNRIYALENKT